MTICTHPLDELCAFLGAVGFLLAFFGLTIGIGQWIMEGERYKATNTYPALLYVALVGAGILLLVIILGFVNMALPATCISY